jgi:hypothetical protein
MRTWGRVPLTVSQLNSSAIGSFVIGSSAIDNESPQYPEGYQWVEVTTDAAGYNAAVWLTTLAQVLALGLNESPVFGNYGIPAQQSVVTQVLPDYYANQTQQQFSQYFLSLLVTRQASNPPTYAVSALAAPGASLLSPVPQ